ncbi:hypothetical protein BDZ90DRAFT_250814 [Jaminaea rosea]|uniref:DUF6534 domain-containing protein n=1 Tax=Jaminaea rosea TaxID=1569628 RepID=A0A316USS9_9BASI|nr:hypothetical protein BDZ90DRAFT_250814 [Jaminaea rosea]PWN28356.1 hypothetical protein BDZ90DRAFT_250814 [Jaminaea rosea]
MSTVMVPQVFPAMDLSLGCMFIGLMLNVFLFGMSIVQGYMYFVNFPNDKMFMRVYVGVLLIADTLNCVLDCGFMYQYLISHFGNLEYASNANPLFAADPVLTGYIAFTCQCFFAWRVYRLMHSWWCPALIVLTGATSFLSALGTTIGVTIVKTFSEFQKFQVVVILWLACAALADMIITVALVWTLRKSRTGFTATDDVITRLIRGTIQTGAATTIFALADLILFCGSTTTLHLVFNLPLAKLYVNSLLSTLNARTFLSNTHARPAASFDVVNNGTNRGFRGTGLGSGQDTLSTGSPTKPSFKRALGMGGAAQRRQDNIEHGIQVTTVEERFEDSPYATSDFHHHSHSHNQHPMPRRPQRGPDVGFAMGTELHQMPALTHQTSRPGFRTMDSNDTLAQARKGSSSDDALPHAR